MRPEHGESEAETLVYRWRAQVDETDAEEWERGTTFLQRNDTLSTLRDRVAKACGSSAKLARRFEPEVWVCDNTATPVRRLLPSELCAPAEAPNLEGAPRPSSEPAGADAGDRGAPAAPSPPNVAVAAPPSWMATRLTALRGADGRGKLLGRHANYVQRTVILFTLPPVHIHRTWAVTRMYELERKLQKHSWYLRNAVRFVHAINMFVQFSFLAALLTGPTGTSDDFSDLQIAIIVILFVLLGLDALKFDIESQDEHPTARTVFTLLYNTLGIIYLVLLSHLLSDPVNDTLIGVLSFFVFLAIIIFESILIRTMSGILTHFFWIKIGIQIVDQIHEHRHPELYSVVQTTSGVGVAAEEAAEEAMDSEASAGAAAGDPSRSAGLEPAVELAASGSSSLSRYVAEDQ